MTRVCKDCRAEGVTTKRPATYPGPRCTTHHRAAVKVRKARNHQTHISRSFGLTFDEYRRLANHQRGRCYVCRKATGATRRLSVDHEHNLEGCDHPPDKGCRRCVRALVCAQCNRIVLGRYTPEALQRAIEVLTDPPARKVLKPTIGASE